MRGSYLVLVCLTSIYQPLWLFSQLLCLCLFDMQASQKASRTALMFLNFDLSEHSGLMYLGGGLLPPSSIANCRVYISNKLFTLRVSRKLPANIIIYKQSKSKKERWCLPKTSLLTLVESNALIEALAQHDWFNSELVLRAEFDSAQGRPLFSLSLIHIWRCRRRG